MNALLRALLLTTLLLPAGCGYHLVGQGSEIGAIPADVRSISVSGNANPALLNALRQRLRSSRYTVVDRAADGGSGADSQQHATIYVNIGPARFTPSAFDRNGIATQYRMALSGSIRVEHNGDTLWQSGQILHQGDVFVTGGPTSIEASRQRLQQDLGKQWLNDAVGRLRSGF